MHNAFRMGRDEYLKTLTAAYDLAINWKGDTKGPRVTPNDGIAFTTKSEEADVHATDGMKIIRSGKPGIYHRCVKNHYTDRCPEREESTTKKEADKVEDTPKKESAPTKV